MKIDSFDPTKPLETEGYVCNAKGEPLKLQKVILPPLSPTSVQVEIRMVGLCRTDIQFRDNDPGNVDYPILLGHEAVGIVTQIGIDVTRHAIGDTIGIGWIRDCCRECDRCLENRENLCNVGYTGTFLGKSSGPWGKERNNENGGCFIRIQRIEEKFAIKIPLGFPMSSACPLMCAGATMYEPLINYIGMRKKNATVGIIGLGGLGVTGLKLSKMYKPVKRTIAISSSMRKLKVANMLQVDEYWNMSSTMEEEQKKRMGKLDLVIDTRPVNEEVKQVMSWLKSEGVYCRVGVPPGDDDHVQYVWTPMLFLQQSIAGSAYTGSKRLEDMLEMCLKHKDFMIGGENGDVEVIKFETINEAMDSVKNRTNKSYRYVLEW